MFLNSFSWKSSRGRVDQTGLTNGEAFMQATNLHVITNHVGPIRLIALLGFSGYDNRKDVK